MEVGEGFSGGAVYDQNGNVFYGYTKDGRPIGEMEVHLLKCQPFDEQFLEVKLGIDEDPNALQGCYTYEEVLNACILLDRAGFNIINFEPFLEGCDWVNALVALWRDVYPQGYNAKTNYCPRRRRQ